MKHIRGVILLSVITLMVVMLTRNWGVSEQVPAGKPLTTTRVAPIAFVAGGGLLVQDGPAMSAIANWHSIVCRSPTGDIFIIDPAQEQIYLYIQKEKRIYTLCTGMVGYRDGPAGQAEIGIVYNDVTSPGWAFDAEGNFYFSDNLSGTIRRVSRRKNGTWYFCTVLGGGKKSVSEISYDQSVPAGEIGPLGTSSLAAGSDGAIYLGVYYEGIYKLAGGKLTHIKTDKRISRPKIIVDNDGNLYALNSRYTYLKIEKDGRVTYLCGERGPEYKKYAPPDIPPQSAKCKDGQALQALFYNPAALGVEPDGSALYVGGGDEHAIRRLKPISPDGWVTTLMKDGTWRECCLKHGRGQWLFPPCVNNETGDVYASSPWPWYYRRYPEYSRAWINELEGRDAKLIRKAFHITKKGTK